MDGFTRMLHRIVYVMYVHVSRCCRGKGGIGVISGGGPPLNASYYVAYGGRGYKAIICIKHQARWLSLVYAIHRHARTVCGL